MLLFVLFLVVSIILCCGCVIFFFVFVVIFCVVFFCVFFFFFQAEAAFGVRLSFVGSENGIRDSNGAKIMAIRSYIGEKAGMTVEDFKDTTRVEFMELAKKVVDANGVPMLTSSGGSEIVIEMLQSAGASPMQDGEVKLVDNAALKKAIEVYKQLIEEGIMVDYTDWDQYIASMNKGEAAGVIQGCWIMSSIQAAEDQSGEWAIVNMPALDEIDGATNYANCGGASWAVSSNCKNTELAFDFLNATFGSSVEL